jgi:adenosine phosphosulfate reductase beta subunit
MPTFVYMTRCDGCGHCVDICPSDIMHIDKVTRRAYNIEPNMCWECYSCVKACPHQAIDVRGYADFAPLGHSVRVKMSLRRPRNNATASCCSTNPSTFVSTTVICIPWSPTV